MQAPPVLPSSFFPCFTRFPLFSASFFIGSALPDLPRTFPQAVLSLCVGIRRNNAGKGLYLARKSAGVYSSAVTIKKPARGRFRGLSRCCALSLPIKEYLPGVPDLFRRFALVSAGSARNRAGAGSLPGPSLSLLVRQKAAPTVSGSIRRKMNI